MKPLAWRLIAPVSAGWVLGFSLVLGLAWGLVWGPVCSLAQAQTPADHPSCAPWKAKWASVGQGSDIKAMDGVIGMIPALCPALKAEASARRGAVARDAEQARADAAKQQAGLDAARRANDPCLQARNDWSYMQTASEATVRAYRDGLPAPCAAWREQATERLTLLAGQHEEAERQRQAKEAADKQAQRQAEIANQQRIEAQQRAGFTAAAQSLGLAGRWTTVVVEYPDQPSDCGTSSIYQKTISIGDGTVTIAEDFMSAPRKILRAGPDSVVVDDGTGNEEIFTVQPLQTKRRTLTVLTVEVRYGGQPGTKLHFQRC